jgi:membrane fusion protein, multidrug efflux system
MQKKNALKFASLLCFAIGAKQPLGFCEESTFPQEIVAHLPESELVAADDTPPVQEMSNQEEISPELAASDLVITPEAQLEEYLLADEDEPSFENAPDQENNDNEDERDNDNSSGNPVIIPIATEEQPENENANEATIAPEAAIESIVQESITPDSPPLQEGQPIQEEKPEQESSTKKPEPHLVAIGTIYPQYKSTIASQVTGRVENVFVQVGDCVKKDQPLAKLDTIFFEIDAAQKEAALQGAKIELEDALLHLNRMKNLWEKPEGESPSVPQKRFDDAKTKYEQGLIAVKLAEENLKRAKVHLDEATIKAPFDGVITKRFVDQGECITASPVTKMLELQHIATVYVEFAIAQIDLGHIQVGSHLLLEVEGANTQEYPAKIDLIYPDIDENTRSIKCRAFITDESYKLRPGSLVKVQIFPNAIMTEENTPKLAEDGAAS